MMMQLTAFNTTNTCKKQEVSLDTWYCRQEFKIGYNSEVFIALCLKVKIKMLKPSSTSYLSLKEIFVHAFSILKLFKKQY